MADNPFTHCKPVEHRTGWYVESDFWRVKAASELDARRISEIIQAAYVSGREDLRGQINDLLSPPMEDGTVKF